MPGRKFTSADYRFSVNGTEKSPEIGSGHNTTYFRELDSRTGRWWSTDPVWHPWQSNYSTFDNNPIALADPSGSTTTGGPKKGKRGENFDPCIEYHAYQAKLARKAKREATRAKIGEAIVSIGKWLLFGGGNTPSHHTPEQTSVKMAEEPPSTRVTKNDDGTYTVVGGEAEDGDNGIYIDNDGKNGELIGYSATPYSFFYSENGTWPRSIINPTDMSGKDFLNDLKAKEPFFLWYMMNAYGGQKYDFKRLGTDKDNSLYNDPAYHYRGMPLLGLYNGKQIFGSARDVGNIGAGFIAGNSGLLVWQTARLGLDGLQILQEGRADVVEGLSTQYAERLGYRIGGQYLTFKTMLARSRLKLPGEGHLLGTQKFKINLNPIFLNDFVPNKPIPQAPSDNSPRMGPYGGRQPNYNR